MYVHNEFRQILINVCPNEFREHNYDESGGIYLEGRQVENKNAAIRRKYFLNLVDPNLF